MPVLTIKKMHQSIKLPITNGTQFTAYQIRGFEASILNANYDKAEELFFNTCINCSFRQRPSGRVIFDYTCNNTSWFLGQDVFLMQTIPVNPEKASKEYLIDTVASAIDNGIYVSGFFNERYIHNKSAFGKYDFRHSFLIYGYDDEGGIFNAIGYTANSKFETYEITFADFAAAMINCSDPVIWFRAVNPNLNAGFDVIKVHEELGDYLRSDYTVNNATGKNMEDVYGLLAHRAFRDYVKRTGETKSPLDIRLSRFFYENKAFMLKRLDFMHSNGLIGNYHDQYESAVKKSESVHLYFIKYNMTKSASAAESVYRLLGEINQIDESVLSEVYKDLSAYIGKQKSEVYL